MKIKLLIFSVAIILGGCGTKKSTTGESTAVSQQDSNYSGSHSAGGNQTECYALTTMNGDTVQLSLTRQGPAVSGTLLYSLAEKDRNMGVLRGRMRGDTLLADYVFESEGETSVREVVFLAKGDGFVEGYGAVEEKNGRMIFSPDSTITFSDDEVLKKIACQ